MTETKTRTVTPGSDVTWSVSADGFDTQTGTFDDISESQSLDVYLLGSYGTIEKTVKDVFSTNISTWILLNDGTLWGCGSNGNGQQGSGDTTDVTTFTQRLTDVKKIAVHEYQTWAIKNDGTLWGCGKNDFGQQGNGQSGNNKDVTTFTQRLTDVKDVSCNEYMTWAIKTDNTLWGCGYNTTYQQGSGDTTDVTTFTQRLTNVKKIGISDWNTYALKNDDTVWACGDSWGHNFTQILSDVNNLFSTGTNSAWVIKNDGTLWGRGANDSGQQGSGNTTRVSNFTQRLTDVKNIAITSYLQTGTTWAIKNDGTLWGCGHNTDGQQGSGNTSDVKTFTQRLTDVSKVSCSNYTTWALKTDGTLWGCGENVDGQQGSGNKTDVLTFTQRLTDVKDVSGSCNHTFVIKTDGTLWGCGSNWAGQQGSGDTTDVTTFTKRNLSVTGYNSATLTINPNPSDAVVTINSESVKTKDIRKGTSAEWSVSKNGYETQSGTISHIYDDTTLNINLEEE